MANHRVKIASKFKGEIVVNELNLILKGDKVYNFDDDQFNVIEIQTLMKKGILQPFTEEPEVQQEVEQPEEDDNISFEEETPTEPAPNTPVAWDIKKQKLVTQKETVDEHIKENINNPDKPVVWDAEKKGLIGGKEATKKVFGQSEGINMDTQTGDIDFSKEKEPETENRTSFVKKGRGRPKGSTKKKEKVSVADKFKNIMEKTKDIPQPKVISKTGKEIKDFVYDNNNSTVNFVDEEQNKQLIKEREANAAKISQEEKEAKLKKYLKLDNNNGPVE